MQHLHTFFFFFFFFIIGNNCIPSGKRKLTLVPSSEDHRSSIYQIPIIMLSFITQHGVKEQMLALITYMTSATQTGYTGLLYICNVYYKLYWVALFGVPNIMSPSCMLIAWAKYWEQHSRSCTSTLHNLNNKHKVELLYHLYANINLYYI